jgi:uncharacterized delta-60 repeat protein
MIARRASAAFAVAAMFVLLTALPASAQPGDPDVSFGGGFAYVRTSIGPGLDIGSDVLRQPNGRIVVVGQAIFGDSFEDSDFGLARYVSNGNPDNTFSGDSRQHTDFGGLGDAAYGVALDGEKIVAVGFSHFTETRSKFAVARYGTSGGLDHSFSNDGKVRTAFPGYVTATANDVAVQDDGKIVVAGRVATTDQHLGGARGGSSVGDFGVARYKTGGKLDKTFGGDGRVSTDFNDNSEYAQRLVLLDSGDILVAGAQVTTGGAQRVVLTRYNSSGSLDGGFGGDGKVTVDMVPGEFEQVIGLAVRDDGRIVVGAQVTDGAAVGSESDIGVLVLKPNGDPEPSFGGGDGIRFVDYGGPDYVTAMTRDSNGKLFFVGTELGSPSDLLVFRLTGGGAKDEEFGNSGRATMPQEDGASGYAITIDDQHRPIAAGRVGVGGDGDFFTCRLQA